MAAEAWIMRQPGQAPTDFVSTACIGPALLNMGLTGAMSMTYVQLVGSDLNGPTTGAIKGACDHVEMGNLTELLAKIQPAIYQETLTEETGQRNSANASFVENVADINVKRSVKSFVDRSYILEQMIEKGEIAIIGAKHDLESGAVEFFDETMIACQADVREKMRF